MGKISDALEKLEQEHKASASAGNAPKVVRKGSPANNDLVKGEISSLKTQKPTSTQQFLEPDNAFDKPQKKEGVPLADGQLRYEKNGFDKNLVSLLQPLSFEAEQFKILRTKLLFPQSGKPPRTVMITSAVPGEGKSFVAANLAISIARNINEHVLLMDCDLRRPSIHNSFFEGDAPGLSEYLSKGFSLDTLLLKTNIDKLTILPGGQPPENPAELLSSEKMATLLSEVKNRYADRYIIIDSPPPQVTAETNALARQIDTILLVVKYGSTPRELVDQQIKLLGKEKIFGVIFNQFDLRSAHYFGKVKYYGKYGRYYNKS